MLIKINLPTYEEALNEVRETEKPSALAWFITEHEPGGMSHEAKFRLELQEALAENALQAALTKQSQLVKQFEHEFEKFEEAEKEHLKYLDDSWRACSKIAFWTGHLWGVVSTTVCFFMGWLVMTLVKMIYSL